MNRRFYCGVDILGMPRKNGNKKENEKEPKQRAPKIEVHPDVKNVIIGIFAFLGAALFVLSYIGNGGSVGGFLFRVFDYLLGKGYFFAPLVLILVGFSLVRSTARAVVGTVFLGGLLFLLSTLSVIQILFGEETGGLLGVAVGGTLFRLFDFWASLVISVGLLAISILLIVNKPFWVKEETDEEEEEIPVPLLPEVPAAEAPTALLQNIQDTIKAAFEKKESEAALPVAASSVIVDSTPRAASAANGEEMPIRKIAKKFGYKKLPLELLAGDRGTPSSGDIRANMNIVKRTLENFGIDVEMGEVSVGPTVTQYTLRPAEGVKLAKITALHNDLSLALAAHPIRIEAPIPGKPLVGVEVPNKSVALVGLRALLEHKIFQDAGPPLLTVLGRDVAGMPVFADLSKMPHLLVAGATGAGKSVGIHTMITSFLYRNPPEILRFIIVDPKRVELSVYNDIPHLLTPIITDPKKTIQALRWATREMDRRYDLLSETQSRDITSYNTKVAKSEETNMLPYIVIVIDELADLMATFPREVEASIIRIAQMARAVGIHLVVSTQRPSVEVITGLIKANIPSRVAFQVVSQVDSRTILDMSGAEKLLGNGDMLFLSGDLAKPRRIQGAFVSEQEVKRVVDFLREEVEGPEYNEGILDTAFEEKTNEGDMTEGDDPLYEDARVIVVEAGKASASYLQRRLRVGYARAARLLDLLESNGIVGPADGAKAREILIATADTKSDFHD